MNRQGVLKDGKWIGGIEWTRVHGLPGFTSNPIKGCEHECRWRMPDGEIAICYAESTASKFTSAYPGGFSNITFDPKELREIEKLREPAGIFIGSMSDVFGRGVEEEWINAVLDTIGKCRHHVFLTLTKNAPRLLKFQNQLPSNLWVGVSAPPTFMFGHELTPDQQRSMVMKQLVTLREIKVPVRWMSIEPLSFDIAAVLEEWLSENGAPLPLEWAVVGAASRAAKLFQPDPAHMNAILSLLDTHEIPVFFKGNLEWKPWRENFPGQDGRQLMEQSSLL